MTILLFIFKCFSGTLVTFHLVRFMLRLCVVCCAVLAVCVAISGTAQGDPANQLQMQLFVAVPTQTYGPPMH
jgi:hypothetical protein